MSYTIYEVVWLASGTNWSVCAHSTIWNPGPANMTYFMGWVHEVIGNAGTAVTWVDAHSAEADEARAVQTLRIGWC